MNHIFFKIQLLTQQVFVESLLGNRRCFKCHGWSDMVQGSQVLKGLKSGGGTETLSSAPSDRR